ncbi:MAG: efflux RND transporter permease subunit, partial [Pseudomonadales bacterium]|nr:efflux RND transporter permease subunit [Pseudomonadales bacterium]
QLKQFQALEADFVKQDNILLVVVPNSGSIYTEDNLNALTELTALCWQLPFSRQVSSITNLPKTRVLDDEISSSPLVAEDTIWDQIRIASLQSQVQGDPLFASVVSSNGEAALISVQLEMPQGELRASNQVVEAAQQHVNKIVQKYPDLNVYLHGTVLANYSIEKAVLQDVTTLVPISAVLIFIILIVLLRDLTGTMLTLGLISLTAMGTFGAFAWLGIPFTPVAGTTPTMLTVIAVADGIHLLITYYHQLGEGDDKKQAIKTALKINFMPMLITSLTTAIGLLCLNFSDSPPYRALGNTVAFGAILAFILTVTVLPALILWLPMSKKSELRSKSVSMAQFGFMEKLGNAITNRSVSIFVFTAIAVLFVSYNLTKNQVDDQWDKYFDETFSLTQAFAQIEEHFGGGHFLEFRVDSGQKDGIYNPQYMKELAAFTQWLEQQPEVGRVHSFSDKVKMLNQVLNADDPGYYRIPDEQALISQSVLMYEMSLPFGMNLDDQLDFDRTATRVTAYLYAISSEDMIGLQQRAVAWGAANASALQIEDGTGIDIVFAHMAQRNSYKLLAGTLVALVLISVILILVFRSFKLGLLSLVPNIIPVVAAYGFWGMTIGKIDLALSIVGAMCLGLVVDDTIHFLAKYRFARLFMGAGSKGAVLYAFKTVGLAMVITSLILGIGFSTLAISHFNPTWNMGVLLAVTIIFAVVLDFLLLPGLLLMFDKDSGNEGELPASGDGGLKTTDSDASQRLSI